MRDFFRELFITHEEGEKKVEYVELIYDLIFVYLIGRNNLLIEHVTDGFVAPNIYLSYLLVTLIAIQIWYLTCTFINRYGANEPIEYVGLFLNMYLLYYMGDGTRLHWETGFYRYNIAWALILLNLAFQYWLKLKGKDAAMPWETAHIRFYLRLLLIQAGMVILSLPLYHLTGYPFSPLAMIAGILIVTFGKRSNALMEVDFPHLAERVMLYVVFTFGEMIVTISGYFGADFTFSQCYFSLMAFLVVVGLFMTYGIFYDRILDRTISTDGTGYMQLHIFIIFALNNITVALDFMRNDSVALVPKTCFLVASFVLYYLFLALAGRYTRQSKVERFKTYRYYLLTIAVYALLMFLTYRNGRIGIALTALVSFVIYFLMRWFWAVHIREEEG